MTELVGFSGAGKTQLSLTLAMLTAADPELFGMVQSGSRRPMARASPLGAAAASLYGPSFNGLKSDPLNLYSGMFISPYSANECLTDILSHMRPRPGRARGVLFIDAEGKFSAQRHVLTPFPYTCS